MASLLLMIALIVSRLIDEILFTRKNHLLMLEYTSNYDQLTGLPNRLKVFKLIEYLNSRNAFFSLLFLDYDGFKAVNDNYGHHVGDKVLVEGGKRLKSCVRETDVVSRLGGDEFLIVLRDIIDDEVIKKTCSKIKDSICEVMVFDKVTCSVGISIGVSIQNGMKTTEELVNEADEKMYVDKEKEK